MAKLQFSMLLVLLGASVAMAQVNQLETPRLTERDQRKEFDLFGEDNAFEFRFSEVTGGSRVDNAAVLQLQMDKAANVFLSTLPAQGSAQFATVLKPCGILLPHMHERATEFYTVLQGVMSAGIAQENGGLQNITMGIGVGEVFIVPDGLLHYNHNNRCSVNVFLQSFNSADPGAINVINALAALGASGNAGKAAIKASNAASVTASPQGAFALDQACLKACGLPPTGAPGNGLATLNPVFKPLFGLP